MQTTQPPLLPHTIPEHFASVVSRHGDRPAVVARSPAPAAESLASAAVPPTTTLTFAGLDALSGALAEALRAPPLGVRRGDRVAVSLGNVAEHAALAYAAFKLGAVLVPLNPGFGAPQLAAALAHLGAAVLVIGAVTDLAYKPCRGRSNLGLLSELVPDLARGGGRVESPGVPTLRAVVVVDNRASHPEAHFPLESLRALTPYDALVPPTASFCASSPSSALAALVSAARPVVPDDGGGGGGSGGGSGPLAPGDTANVQFTSGTTSAPKAAMLTHAGILNNGRLIADRMGLAAGDRVVCPPPLFHCFGSVLGLMATATTGAALLLPSPAFDPAAALRMAAEHRATALYGVATMFVAELDLLTAATPASAAFRALLPRDGLAALRKGIAAGSSVPEALMRRLFGALGLRDLVICYGMTETSPVSAMTAPRDPLDRRTRTVGRALPHTALKVVAPGDRARVVPRGERGELAVAGYLVMRGYWGDEAATRRDLVVDDGDGRAWMYTGDEARMDADGYVEITGRIKDLIIRGGENVHPLEVENCLLQHPLVRDASVVAVPDDRYGEAVAAFVIPAQGVRTLADESGSGSGSGGDGRDPDKSLSKDDMREWVGRNLSGHLVPKHVFWIDEYPKTASGKIEKYKLRELARELVSR